MEFTWDISNNDSKLQKYYDYIQAFSNKGVWDNDRVSYYDGQGAWFLMSHREDPTIQIAFDSLADIIANRHYYEVN